MTTLNEYDLRAAYENRTIGRYAPRLPAPAIVEDTPARRPDDEAPMILFFDGKSFTPVNHKKGADLFTGSGFTAASLRPTRLGQNDWDYARAYALCEYTFGCVEMVASDISSIKKGVRNRQTKADWPDHIFMQALAWARRYVYQDIISLWQKGLYIWGETYLLPISNGFNDWQAGRPFYSGLQWLNPLVVEPLIYYNQLQGFDYRAGGNERYTTDQIIFDKVGSIFDDIRGQSRVSVALTAENIDIEIKRYTLDSFLKDMRMQGILTGRQGSGVTEPELKAVTEELKKQKDARLVAIAAALEYKPVQHAFNDTQFKASEDAQRRIAAALRIPVSVAGAWFSATYQSAPAQIAFYYESVIFRELDRLALFINEVVMPYFDPWGTGEFYYDKDSAMSLIEDRTAKQSMYDNRLKAGGITQNEYRVALGMKPVLDGDVYFIPPGVQLVPAGQLKAYAQQQHEQRAAAITPPAPALPAPAIAAVPAAPALPPPSPDAKSTCLMIGIGANPELVAFQNRVKAICAQQGIADVKWNNPDEFHVTLAYSPLANDVQIAQLKEMLDGLFWADDMTLKVGSLHHFDNVGEYPIVFLVSKSTDLLELHESAHELFTNALLPMREHYEPGKYKPHITMGYASKRLEKRITYKGNTRIPSMALKLELKYGDQVVYSRAFVEAEPPEPEPAAPIEEEQLPVEPDDNANKSAGELDPETPFEPLPSVLSAHDAALIELDAWKEKTRRGAKKAFKNYLIRDEVAEAIRLALAEAQDKEAVKAVFINARELLSYKAIQATRLDFEAAFDDVLSEARKGNLKRSRWSSITRSLISQYVNKAARDGLSEGGVDDEPDEALQKVIDAHIAAQSEYVTNLGSTLYKDEDSISDAMADQKAAMWWTKSIYPMYVAGFTDANGNQMMEFSGIGGEESCHQCATLEGQRHRAKEWEAKRFWPGVNTDTFDCGGWQCEHKLVPVSGRSRGSWV